MAMITLANGWLVDYTFLKDFATPQTAGLHNDITISWNFKFSMLFSSACCLLITPLGLGLEQFLTSSWLPMWMIPHEVSRPPLVKCHKRVI